MSYLSESILHCSEEEEIYRVLQRPLVEVDEEVFMDHIRKYTIQAREYIQLIRSLRSVQREEA